MIKQLYIKLKEALFSVLPVSLIVIIASLTPLISLTSNELGSFVGASFLLIIGIALFNLGSDLAMTPMGDQVGSSLMKTKKMSIVIIVCFIMGLLVTIAEPDLSVLATQVSTVIDSTLLVVSIGIGVGLFLVIAVLKIVFKKDLSSLLMLFYMLAFSLAAIMVIRGNGNFLALSFDSGGVTTGPITVPFIMALGVGIANTIGGKRSKENSFGLISLCSIGPIVAILFLGIFIKGDLSFEVSEGYLFADNFFTSFLKTFATMCKEVLISLSLIVAFFLIIQFVYLKLPKKKLIQIGMGIVYTFLGLVIFLSAVNVAFMPIGFKIGTQLGKLNPAWIIAFGFLLGFVVVLAEPAVHVLNKQVEDITQGGVSKKSMLIALSCGVGLSIGLSMIRISVGFSILYFLVPGYFISLGLSIFCPKMYTAIAFDSGGVASGPLTSSFILPFAVGACIALNGNDTSSVMSDAFGIVAMVAMTPLITIQFLGFKSIVTRNVKEKVMLKRIVSADDEQIINF